MSRSGLALVFGLRVLDFDADRLLGRLQCRSAANMSRMRR